MASGLFGRHWGVLEGDEGCPWLMTSLWSGGEFTCMRYTPRIRKDGLSWWHRGRNPPANAGDTGLIPGLGRFHVR